MAFYYDSQTGAEELIRELERRPVFYAEVILNDRLHKWMVDQEYRDYGSNIQVLKDLTDQISEIRSSMKTITKPKPKIRPVFKTVKIGNQEYKTVVLGNQEWMAENLKVTSYRNGDEIPDVKDMANWGKLETGARCAYKNEESNADTYGYLYNWYAVADKRTIAPEGWHVSTDEEWKELEMFLGMSQKESNSTGNRGINEGSKLAGRADLWYDGILDQNAAFGQSGFAALPGGCRYSDGHFNYMVADAHFWLATEGNSDSAWTRLLIYNSTTILRLGHYKVHGLSVRLVRD